MTNKNSLLLKEIRIMKNCFAILLILLHISNIGKTQIIQEKDEGSIKKETFVKSKKVKRELGELEKAIKVIVKNNVKAPKPRIEIDTMGEYEKGILKKECEEIISPRSYQFKVEFIEEYPKSSYNTKKFDGEMFCIYKIPIKSNNPVRIFYKRNEGGHLSDQIILKAVNLTQQKVINFELMSHYQREGYDKKIESTYLSSRKIQRRIIEILGWRLSNDESGENQPRSETIQLFEILESGEIKLLKEKIENYNFEKYLEN